MAAVTQTVQSYLMGVSKVADKDKMVGTVRDVNNVYPDVTDGLTKRPGTLFAATIGPASVFDGAYYFLYRFNDKEEIYVGIIEPVTGTLSIFNQRTGVIATITGSQNNYLQGTSDDFRVVQRQDELLILNKSVTTSMSSATITANTIKGEVNSIAEIPTSGLLAGDIYKIVGIAGSSDDFVLQWDGSTWNEVIENGSLFKLEASTMPHLLVRTSTDNFTLSQAPWVHLNVGLNNNDLHPSFIGSTINNLFYHKNRLGILSQDNVIMSQPLEYYNLFPLSVMSATDADPIDIVASSSFQTTLFAVQPTLQGLVLFGTREQFILTSGNNSVLTPSTAAIRSVSSFETYTEIDPLLVDQNIFFTAQSFQTTRVQSMQLRGDNNSPVVVDVGKPVVNWLPFGINRAISSSNNQLIALYNTDLNFIYFYRFYSENNEQLLRTWFKWEMPGKVLGMFIEQDQLFIAVSCNGTVSLLVSYINPNPNVPVFTNSDGNFTNPLADFVALPTSVTYDSLTKLSTIILPFNDLDNSKFKAIAMAPYSGGAENGSYWELTKVNATTFTVRQDLSQIPGLLIGYTYPYEVNIPTIYFRNKGIADFTASLTISRTSFQMGLTGACDFEVKRLGGSEFRDVGSIEQSAWYRLDSAPLTDNRTFTIPIHQKNDNFELRISSDTPYPVSLLSMSWEGQYSPRFYKRA
jgi:hypothetical protein